MVAVDGLITGSMLRLTKVDVVVAAPYSVFTDPDGNGLSLVGI